jgi:hypothetical protein
MLGGLVSVFAGHLIETAKLRAYALALYAAAATSLLVASIFGLVALRHWIAITYGSNYPELWIALGFVVIATPLIAIGLYLQQKKPKTHPAADIALIAGPPVLRLAARNVSARTVVVVVVLAAGVALGRRIVTRRSSL